MVSRFRSRGAAAAALIALSIATATPAYADRSYVIEMNCDGAEVNLPDNAARIAKYVKLPAEVEPGYTSPFSPEQVRKEYDSWSKSNKQTFLAYLRKCTANPKLSNAVSGDFNMETAYIKHALSIDSWHMSANLALQQLTRCASDFFAQQKGAECQTKIDEIAKHKVEWSLAESR